MSDRKRIAVLGASGFVGGAVAGAAQAKGHDLVRVRAPRLPPMAPEDGNPFLRSHPRELSELTEHLRGIDAVVNAAGDPDASSRDRGRLVAANGILPGLVAAAAAAAGTPRFVHVSSAVVQGRRPRLDDTLEYDAFSDYARSKVLGERLALSFGGGRTVVYRPPSVHGVDRRVTRLTAKIASSPIATVARPGDDPTPQALVANVADAVLFLATFPEHPPQVVPHPWEGLTTRDLMELLGGKRPLALPRRLASGLVKAFEMAGRAVPRLAADARRVEMLWFGQDQAESWLSTVGWSPPAGRRAWKELGLEVRNNLDHGSTGDRRK